MLRLFDPPRDAHQLFGAATAYAPGGNLDVLPPERAHHLGHSYTRRLQLRRVQEHANLSFRTAEYANFSNPVHRFETPPEDFVGQGREFHDRDRRGRKRQRHDRLRRGIEFLHDRRVDVLRERSTYALDLAADILRRVVHAAPQLELHDDLRDALERHGRNVAHALDRVERLLHRPRDFLLDTLSAGSRQCRLHRDDRHVDRRELVDRETPVAEQPEHHQAYHDHRGEDRAPDRDAAQSTA